MFMLIETYFSEQEMFKEKIQGILLPTGSSLLLIELEKSDKVAQILALIASAAFE